MNYSDGICVGDRLTINTDNPMNCGWLMGQNVYVLGLTCTGDPVVTDFQGSLNPVLYEDVGFSKLNKILKPTGSQCISLQRYCLSRELVDDDKLWDNKLERLGI
jgi:hypothetical protein